ncbi:MAG: hypothetical protein ABIA97_04220 [Candidatus Omnitrophota bacterium]
MSRIIAYYRRKISSKLGQATTEIAVMGIIILIVFGVLLRYAQMMNEQQEIKMYTHRKALELAKMRRDNDQYGQVTLVAMKEVFPINLFSSEREPNYVSSSASIAMHEATLYYKDFKVDRTQPDHVGATYYQIGTDMINNDTAVVMPYMKVKRKIDVNDAPTTPWDANVDWLKEVATFGNDADPDPEDYVTLEPAPIADVKQFIRTVSSNQYARSENFVASSYSDNTTMNIEQTSTYEFMDEDTIRAQDMEDGKQDIIDVLSIPGDVVMRTVKTVDLGREWTTPK